MPIRVESEIGRLRRVLVHRPGPEIDRMVPDMMEQLLFDDILYGEQARREHDGFCEVIKSAGVETLEAEVLLAEVLERTDAREEALEDLGRRQDCSNELIDRLGDLEPQRLARALIAGVRSESRRDYQESRAFELAPVPNYFFQRDPQVVLGDRVLLACMATEARQREPQLAKLLFRYHPELGEAREVLQIGNEGDLDEPHSPFVGAHLEGGDVLVPRGDTLIVGASQRTNRRGIEFLAEALRSRETSFCHLIFVELPSKRSYMHIDTVFTFIDQGLCLAYLPVVEPGHRESVYVYHVDLTAGRLAFTFCPSLLEALAEVGIETEAVPCGGGDRIVQEREQWTDGANAFALAPGVVLLYRRNRRTIEELGARGWRVLRETDVLEGGEELLGHGKTVVTLQGNELSRARGGPRCMTMPLERAAVGD